LVPAYYLTVRQKPEAALVLDEIIKGGTVIDGTGAPGRSADVGIRNGRVVAIGTITEAARQTIDADGALVTPGIVDPHTHYDAQLMWDPTASPSAFHGVTTVIGGNCGFTLAPLRPNDGDYLRRMMARVEGMPLPALEQGVDWSWESFGEYLNKLDGAIAVNAGFLVGHCAIRRYVMGTEATERHASADELAAMVGELRRGIQAGGLGFSFTQSSSHSDGDGKPVASRVASAEELLALCAETGRHPGTTLEGIVQGCLDKFDDAEIELLAQLSAAARRPLNWNVLTVDSREPDRVPRQLSAGDRAIELGGRLVALTMPILVPMNMSFNTFCGLWLLPGWQNEFAVSVPERIAKLRDPAMRARLNTAANSPEAGVFRRLADWHAYVIGDTYSAANEGLKGRIVSDIAAERGTDAWNTLLDIVIADDLRTVLWPMPQDRDQASWDLRAEVWNDPRAMIGGSDAGAHLDRMCGAPYPTRFLGDCLRGRKLLTPERAIQLMTQAPAALFGLRDRGTLQYGSRADIAIFDPATVGSMDATLVHDLPGNCARLTAGSTGVKQVLVNGVTVVVDGQATGLKPGTLLRSGTDTYTVATS
jgi:N-acyl-D-aspartate/D-glutamate deacylase